MPLADTAIEQQVATWLAEAGLPAVAQHPLLPTVTVDFWLPEHGLVVECQGTYFHADPTRYARQRLTAEQQRKRHRDRALAQYLARAGLRLLVLWEEEIRHEPERCQERLALACRPPGAPAMSTIERQTTTPEGLTLAIVRGDLCAEAVDAIVNAANESLQHGGGVAAAIVRRGGAIIQDESDAWVRRHGRVPTGSVALTTAGDLPAGAVIHAVGPIWHGGDQGEPDLLRSAVAQSLDRAHAEGFASVALPAISSGIFGYPKADCAALLLDTAIAWSAAHPTSPLRTVRFTNIDEATTSLFCAAFDARFG